MTRGVRVPDAWSNRGPSASGGKPLRPRAFRAEIVDPNGGFVRQLRVSDGIVDESDLFNPTSGAGDLSRSPHIVKIAQLDDNIKPSSTSYWYYDTAGWYGPHDTIPDLELPPPTQPGPELGL